MIIDLARKVSKCFPNFVCHSLCGAILEYIYFDEFLREGKLICNKCNREFHLCRNDGEWILSECCNPYAVPWNPILEVKNDRLIGT